MIISCPECEGKVSDKAFACPHCGYPIQGANSTQIVEVKPQREKRTHMRLPNGTGTIRKLSGNRRKPYVAYPYVPISEYQDNGLPPNRKPIGYFETWYEAYDALMGYTRTEKKNSITFAEVYDKWWEDRENSPFSKKSKSTAHMYALAFKKLHMLHDKDFTELKKTDLQDAVNTYINQSPTTMRSMKILMNQMYKYALQEGIVDTDYSKFVETKRGIVEKGKPLTEKEIEIMWKHKSDEYVQIALILLYTGLRVSELKVVKIDLKNKLLKGGLKTVSGKERVIPIHPTIYSYVKKFDQETYDVAYFSRHFKKRFEDLGLDSSNKRLSPHALRHTFSWLADVYKMDEFSKHLIMGHSLGKDVEKETYGHRTIDELRREIEKIEVPYI